MTSLPKRGLCITYLSETTRTFFSRTYKKIALKWENTFGACNQLGLQNINLQDWKYTSFVVFVGYSQSNRRHNAICTDELVADVAENIGLKFQFSSWFSIHLLLHQLYRFYYKINKTYKCAIMLSNVLHQSVSYWESLFCKMFLYSLRKHKWIETQLWKGNFNPMFSTTSATSSSVHIALWRRMLWL